MEEYEGHKFFIYDLVISWEDVVKDAKFKVNNPEEGHEDINDGYLDGCYAIVQLMKDKAKEHNIDQKKIGLDRINVDKDSF